MTTYRTYSQPNRRFAIFRTPWATHVVKHKRADEPMRDWEKTRIVRLRVEAREDLENWSSLRSHGLTDTPTVWEPQHGPSVGEVSAYLAHRRVLASVGYGPDFGCRAAVIVNLVILEVPLSDDPNSDTESRVALTSPEGEVLAGPLEHDFCQEMARTFECGVRDSNMLRYTPSGDDPRGYYEEFQRDFAEPTRRMIVSRGPSPLPAYELAHDVAYQDGEVYYALLDDHCVIAPTFGGNPDPIYENCSGHAATGFFAFTKGGKLRAIEWFRDAGNPEVAGLPDSSTLSGTTVPAKESVNTVKGIAFTPSLTPIVVEPISEEGAQFLGGTRPYVLDPGVAWQPNGHSKEQDMPVLEDRVLENEAIRLGLPEAVVAAVREFEAWDPRTPYPPSFVTNPPAVDSGSHPPAFTFTHIPSETAGSWSTFHAIRLIVRGLGNTPYTGTRLTLRRILVSTPWVICKALTWMAVTALFVYGYTLFPNTALGLLRIFPAVGALVSGWRALRTLLAAGAMPRARKLIHRSYVDGVFWGSPLFESERRELS